MKYYNQTPTLTRLRRLKDVQYIPNLNYRDIAAISLRAYYAYAKRGYQIAIITIEDIDEALRQEGD
jgi:hypothetical protein